MFALKYMDMRQIKVLLLLLLLVTSCTTTKYVEVPTETIKIEYKDKYLRDSIYIKDSTVSDIINDTVFKTKYRYIYKDRILKDTVNKIDTIVKSVIVEKEKEVNKLKTWQIVLMIMGGGSIVYILYKLKEKIL